LVDLDKYVKVGFTHVAGIDDAVSDSLVFCDFKGERAKVLISNTLSGFVVTYPENKGLVESLGKTGFYSESPRLLFLKLWYRFFPPKVRYMVHPSAVVMGNVKLGVNVRIGPGSVIGCDGFSQVRDEDGCLVRVPHVGGVRIGDNVEIQSNCCVSCGTFGDTVVGSGTFVDNLVHIAHNDVIGCGCRIAAGVVFGGSVSVGDRCFFGVGCMIRDQVCIGSDVFVGMGSVVVGDVPDGVVVLGNPARVVRRNVL